jgi:hypothetical protein
LGSIAIFAFITAELASYGKIRNRRRNMALTVV